MLTEREKQDIRRCIFDALSEFIDHEFRESDWAVPTTKFFTPADLSAAVDFLETETGKEIPRNVYWKDTIGEVVDSLEQFYEENTT